MQISKNDSPDGRVRRLFLELEEKGIFNKKIKLIEDKKITNFQGLNFFATFKQLKYNPLFFNTFLARYNDNVIQFVLLHEAGHIESGSLFRIENILIGLIIAVLVVSFFIWLFLTGILVWIASIITLVIIVAAICLIIRLSLRSMSEGEFSADEYALKKMLENFRISDTCSFIDEIFSAMESIVNDPNARDFSKRVRGQNRIHEFLLKLSGLQNGYHPTNFERAHHLKQIAKCSELHEMN